MSVLDHGIGSAPTHANRGSEKSQFNLHFWVLHRHTGWKLRWNCETAPQIEYGGDVVGVQHAKGDSREDERDD